MSENGGDDDDFGERRSDKDREKGPRRGGQREFGAEREFGDAPGGGGGFGDRGGGFGGGGGGYRGGGGGYRGGDREGGGGGGGFRGGGGGYRGGGDREGGGYRSGGGRFGGGGGGYGGPRGGGGGGSFQDREPRERGPRQNGTLKFFNNDRGFGFITPESGGKDVFVHISAIERSGLQQLAEGTKLSFETEDDRRGRGPQAVNLQLVQE
jgi:CspA family cold shock protein